MRGAGATTNTRDFLPGNANAFGDDATWNPVTGVNWHFYFRTDNATQSVRQFSGGSWGFPAAAPDYSVAFGGTLGQSTAFVEYRISRASLGLGSNLILTGAVWDASQASGRVRFPSSGPGWDHQYLDANMGAANFPTFTGYLKP